MAAINRLVHGTAPSTLHGGEICAVRGLKLIEPPLK